MVKRITAFTAQIISDHSKRCQEVKVKGKYIRTMVKTSSLAQMINGDLFYKMGDRQATSITRA